MDNVIGNNFKDAKTSKKASTTGKRGSKKDLSKEDLSKLDDKVAIWSKGNLHQVSWGALSKGPNIVDKEVAEKWLTHHSVRLATPEEVAAYYNG